MGAAQNQGTIAQFDLQHPFLRNCKSRTTSSSKELLSTIPCQSASFKKWKEQLQLFRSSLRNFQHVLLPINYNFDEEGVCSQSGQLRLEYQYFPRLLSTEIANRKREGKRFTEGELWHLLYILTLVKSELSEREEPIGNVHPLNIFLNETGQIKVACLRSWPGQVTNYRKAVLQQQCGYLAPQDIERLKLGAMDNQINTQSEIFAIGLTILSCTNLQLQRDLYEMKSRNFEEDVFFSRLGKFQHDGTYSEIFRAVVSNLLEIQPQRRMKIEELLSFLSKHDDNIMSKKPLKINNLNAKLEKTVKQMLKAIHPQSNIASAQQHQKTIGQVVQNFINYQQRQQSQNSILPPPANNLPPSSNRRPSFTNSVNPPINSTLLSINNKPSLNNIVPSPNKYSNQQKEAPAVQLNLNKPSSTSILMSPSQEPKRPVINKVFFNSISSPVIKKTESLAIQTPPYKPYKKPSQTIPSKEAEESPIKNIDFNQSPLIIPPTQQGRKVQQFKNQQLVHKQTLIQILQQQTPAIQQAKTSANSKGQSFEIKYAKPEQMKRPIINFTKPNQEIRQVALQNGPDEVKYRPKITWNRQQNNIGKQNAINLKKPQLNTQPGVSEGAKLQVENSLRNKQQKRSQQQIIYKPIITQIWNGQQHSMEQLNKQGFSHNSLINPHYQPESITPPIQTPPHSNQPQEHIQQILKEVIQEKPIKEQSSSQISHQHSPISTLMKDSDKNSQVVTKSINNSNKSGQTVSKGKVADRQIKNESSQLNRAKEEQHNRQVAQQLHVAVAQQIQPKIVFDINMSLSPTVKFWGAKPIITSSKNTPTQNISNVKQFQYKEGVNNKSIMQTQTVLKQPAQEASQNKGCNLKTAQKLQQSEPVLIESTQIKFNDIPSQNNKYILIQEESRHTIEQHTSRIIEKQRQSGVKYEYSMGGLQPEVRQFHTYADVVTEGSFEECWREILTFLRDPTEYSTLLYEDNVKIRLMDDRWSLKIGPGIFDIILNRQQGKVLLRNCEESLCQGQMLGGVYKDQQKKHRIWFNSAYYYKDKKIPSREVIQEILEKCRENITELNK